MALLLACVLCLLPARWREPFRDTVLPLGLATRITAGVEILGGFVAFGFALWRHFHPAIAIDRDALGFSFGAFWFLTFWFTPAGLLILLLMIEGCVRFMHSFHDEPLATLPLALVDGALRLAARVRRPPPEVPDRVEAGDERVVITSARAKDWDAMITLRYRDRLWRLAEYRPLPGGRHQYILEPIPAHHIVRRLVEFC